MRKIFLIMIMALAVLLTACGANEESAEQEKNDESKDYILVDEYAVKDELDKLATGFFMEDYHKHDDGSRCTIWSRYLVNYSSVEFTYYSRDDSKRPFMRLEMQDNRIRVLLKDADENNFLLETEGMIDNVKPDKLKRMAETLMNYESFENVGIEYIDGNAYWVENVKYKDNEIVQFLVCSTGDEYSRVKYGDKYLPVGAYQNEVILDGSHESSLDEINAAVRTNIPEDLLDEWIQWLNS